MFGKSQTKRFHSPKEECLGPGYYDTNAAWDGVLKSNAYQNTQILGRPSTNKENIDSDPAAAPPDSDEGKLRQRLRQALLERDQAKRNLNEQLTARNFKISKLRTQLRGAIERERETTETQQKHELEYKAKLEALQKELYNLNQKYMQDVHPLRARVATQDDEMKELHIELSNMKTQATVSQRKDIHVNQSVHESLKEVQICQTLVRSMEHRFSTFRDALDNSKIELLRSQTDLKLSKERENELVKDLNESEIRASELESISTRLKYEQRQSKLREKDLEECLARALSELEEKEQKEVELNESLTSVNAHVQELRDINNHNQKQLSDALVEREELQGNHRKLLESYNSLEREVATKAAEASSLRDRMIEVQRIAQDALNKADRFVDSIAKTESLCHDMQLANNKLVRELNLRNGTIEMTKDQLSKSRQDCDTLLQERNAVLLSDKLWKQTVLAHIDGLKLLLQGKNSPAIDCERNTIPEIAHTLHSYLQQIAARLKTSNDKVESLELKCGELNNELSRQEKYFSNKLIKLSMEHGVNENTQTSRLLQSSIYLKDTTAQLRTAQMDCFHYKSSYETNQFQLQQQRDAIEEANIQFSILLQDHGVVSNQLHFAKLEVEDLKRELESMKHLVASSKYCMCSSLGSDSKVQDVAHYQPWNATSKSLKQVEKLLENLEDSKLGQTSLLAQVRTLDSRLHGVELQQNKFEQQITKERQLAASSIGRVNDLEQLLQDSQELNRASHETIEGLRERATEMAVRNAELRDSLEDAKEELHQQLSVIKALENKVENGKKVQTNTLPDATLDVFIYSETRELAEENARLAGHNNNKQKIQYLKHIRAENLKLKKEKLVLERKLKIMLNNSQR